MLQADELAFWRDPAARHKLITSSANVRALDAAGALERSGSIRLLDGTRTPLWNGLDIVPWPGHTPGLQTLLVETSRGPVMLASDALHFYENYVQRRPVQVTVSFPQAIDALNTIESLVTSTSAADTIQPIASAFQPSRRGSIESPRDATVSGGGPRSRRQRSRAAR